jgi:hypothetical protein
VNCSNQRFRKAVCSFSVTGPLVLMCWFRYAPQFVHSVLEENLKGTLGSLKAKGLGDEMFKPVIHHIQEGWSHRPMAK